MTQPSNYEEKIYALIDELPVYQLFSMLVIGFIVGLSVFMVLDSAEKTPGTDLDLSELNQEYRDNASCVPPYRDKACYPPENHSNQSVNSSVTS